MTAALVASPAAVSAWDFLIIALVILAIIALLFVIFGHR